MKINTIGLMIGAGIMPIVSIISSSGVAAEVFCLPTLAATPIIACHKNCRG